MAATEPIRDKSQLLQLTSYFLHKGEIRNHLLVNLCVHTALRISDILRLTTDDVYNYKKRRIRSFIKLTEKKTKKSQTIAVNEHLAKALKEYLPLSSSGQALILSQRGDKAISRIQAYRIIRKASEDLDIGRVSCHSLRKSFGYHSWKDGIAIAVIMDIYNHSSYEVTRRYLGISQDDRNEAYLNFCA